MPTLEVQTKVAIHKILYATDFSSCSDAALPYARDLARLYGATVIVAHVAPTVPIEMALGVSAVENREQVELEKTAEKFKDVDHRAVLGSGDDVWKQLAEIVKREKIDLIVLGTHGRTGVERMAMGSVAEDIFRQAKIPVLTVGPHVRRHPLSHHVRSFWKPDAWVEANIHTILYATDFSKESLAAAPFALSLAQEHQAKLVLLHCLEDIGTHYSTDPARIMAYFVEELKRLVPHDAELWCQPEFLVDFGPPAGRILDISSNVNADLIVMGVRGAGEHRAAATHWAASTAHAVVTHATCPVFTVLG